MTTPEPRIPLNPNPFARFVAAGILAASLTLAAGCSDDDGTTDDLDNPVDGVDDELEDLDDDLNDLNEDGEGTPGTDAE